VPTILRPSTWIFLLLPEPAAARWCVWLASRYNGLTDNDRIDE
jgi:hypothetical protein